jgi:hypothetical protein
MIVKITGKNRMLIPAILCSVLLLFSASSIFARQVGKFSYRGEIKTLDNDTTIAVSDTMVAMAERVRSFGDVKADTVKSPPSIFFILDNSTSMSGATGNDIPGNRFTVTSALIDSLVKYFPMAEVGLAVFSMGLYFDPTSKPGIFQTVTSPTRMGLDSTGAFVPLLTLNQTYGTQTGIALLKEVLAVNNGTLTFPTILTSQGGTNINAGFDAAVQAFATAKFLKENQYIIFLSDGESNRPTGAGANSSAFTAATNCPTTYTVYFTKTAGVPNTIRNYTTACQANNYSTRNPNSEAWAYNNTTFDSLMTFLMDNVFRSIINSQVINPATLVVNGQSSNTWSVVDSAFTFGSLFPLTGQITPFNVQLINAQNVATSSAFKVQTQAGLPRSWRNPYDVKLWDRDVLFQSKTGAAITTVSRDIDTLQLRFEFTPGDANYNYTKASIELFNTHATVKDREVLTLTKGTGNFFTGKIKRVVAASGSPSNTLLELAANNDTLIAVFRNNEPTKLPLDTLRVSIPVNIMPNSRIVTAATKDNNGNGYIDAINLTFDSDTSVLPTTNPAGFSVRYQTVTLPVNKVERTPQGSPRQWRLLITEPASTEPLQTFWTPTLQTTLLERIDNMTVTCIDSVAPVIHRAIKVLTNANDRTTDTVKILFSEKVRNPNGAAFALTTPPTNVMAVWLGNTSTSADNLLANIAAFDRVTDSIFYFRMTNGADLNANHWVNIEYNPIILRDASVGNAPAANNRKVQVEIQTVSIIKNFPNPAIATKVIFPNTNPSIINIDNKSNTVVEIVKPGDESIVKKTVLRDKKGSIISIEGIVIPPDPNVAKEVTLTMKIYDVAGNSVTWIPATKIFNNEVKPGTSVYLFWNGFNNAGMRVAPGVYRAVLYVDYPSISNIKDIRSISMLGIAQ